MSVPNRDGKGKPLSCWLTAVFIFPNTATTIAMVTSGLPRSLNGKRARSPLKKIEIKLFLIKGNIWFEIIFNVRRAFLRGHHTLFL